MQDPDVQSIQRLDTEQAPHPEAIDYPIGVNAGLGVNPPRSSPSTGPTLFPPENSGASPVLARDREIVSLLVRLRMLAVAEIREAFFHGKHPSLVTRALKRLVRDGWITTWDEPVPGGGGSPRWAIPTSRGIRWASSMLREAVRAEPWARLVDLMLPRDRVHPLALARGKAPVFLQHQREINKLCVRFRASLGVRLLWVSALDKPFPPAIGGIAMPQPDFVLVVDDGTSPEIVFGEHDRGTESLSRFQEAKIEPYGSLADLPTLCSDTFGLTRFRILVTVIDASRQQPSQRRHQLEECLLSSSERIQASYYLAGRLHNDPMTLLRSLSPTSVSETPE